ncbi:MAG: outer membrane beta-barrel protein [Cycloclasticus sp.]
MIKIINSILVSLIATSSFAVERQDPDFFQLGDFFLIPGISVSEVYNDNVFLQDRDKKSSLITTVSPRARLAYEGDFSLSTLDVGIEKGFYRATSSDNYLDSRVKLGTEIFPSERVKFGASLARIDGHDDRGFGLQDGLAVFDFNSPHEFHQVIGLADFEYGTRVEGAARLEIDISLEDKEYDNHRSVTNFLDRKTSRITTGLAYMLAPATSILIEGSYGDFNYDTATADSKEYRAMVGLEWEATYQTTGFLKLGMGKKEFSNAARTDTTEPAWEVGVDWSPLSYSVFTLRTSKGFSEGEGTGSFIDAQTTSLDWRHDWYDHIGTHIVIENKIHEYGDSDREEDVNSIILNFDYQYSPWLLISTGVLYEERESNALGFDYENTVYNVAFKVNL